MRRDIHGILLLDKPSGVSSNGILQRVKRLFQAKKAGHTGSLDPLATGMLPICFGEATKFSQFLLDADKTYDVIAKLGERTTTADREGEIIETQPVQAAQVERLPEILVQFKGEIEQVPPMFSALKVDGRPLYELARKGIAIERKARRINIFSLMLNHVGEDTFSMRVHCSKGTYIRTLVEDIGNVLGCGAHVTSLRRGSVSPYGDARMFAWDALEALGEQGIASLSACLLPVETAVQVFPALKLSNAHALQLRTGQTIRVLHPLGASCVRLTTQDGKFFGVGEIMPDGRIKPQRLLAAS